MTGSRRRSGNIKEEEHQQVVRCSKRNHDYEVVKVPLLNFRDGLIRHDAAKIEKTVEALVDDLDKEKKCRSHQK